MNFKNTFILLAIIAIAIVCFTFVSDDGEARLCVWDGEGADALASNPLNWDTDTVPVALDDILFDGLNLVNASADDPCTWDLATNSFGTFTIASAYSGTITQSSDMYISGYSQAGGTFTGVTTKWVYCSGDFNQGKIDGGISTDSVRLNMSGTGSLSTNSDLAYKDRLHSLHIIGNIDIISNNNVRYSFSVFNGAILTIADGKTLDVYHTNDAISQNMGTINGNGSFRILLFSSLTKTIGGEISSGSFYIIQVDAGTHSKLSLLNDISPLYISILSASALQTATLDLNGYNLTASSITVGTRGILTNSAGTVSNVTCAAFTSTSGTFNHVNIILQMNGGTLTSTAGEQFETLLLNGTVDLVNAVNITEDMRFVNVDPDYAQIDVYLDTVYHSTISSPYSFGTGTQIGASYSYLPDVQITMSQFYEDIDFSIYAYISSTLPVEYNITGTAASFLSYHEGRIIGIPPDIGNYTYIITTTHESGSEDILTGYILVGSLSTAEYSFDMIWGLILWLVISAFMLLGLLLNIPLIQIVAFMGTIGSIVASLRIPNFEAFLMIFALGNSVLFFIGMIRYRR